MNNKETVYLETIFTAVPLMSDDEKDHLLGIAEEMERKGVETKKAKSSSLANLLSILKPLLICILGSFAVGFCMLYFAGIIEIIIEILLYMLLIAVLIGAFVGSGLL